MVRNVEDTWKEGSAADFYVGNLVEVRGLLEGVKRLAALSDPAVEAGVVIGDDNWFVPVGGDGDRNSFTLSEEYLEMELMEHRQELQRRQQSLESVNKLCDEVRQVNHFVAIAGIVKSTLDDMTKEWECA